MTRGNSQSESSARSSSFLRMLDARKRRPYSFTRSKVGNFPVFYFIFRLVNSKRLSKPFEMER